MFQRGGETNHLYRNGVTGLWTAYGYSAYEVVGIRRSQNQDPVVEGYFGKMQMPVVVFGNDVFEYLVNLCPREERNPGYACLAIPEPARAGTDGYQQWARDLRDSKEGNKG